jgi:hypothetical protein
MSKKQDDIYLRGDSELSESERTHIESLLEGNKSLSEEINSLEYLQSELAQNSVEASERFVSGVIEKLESRNEKRWEIFSLGDIFTQSHWISGACAAAVLLVFTSLSSSGSLGLMSSFDITANLAMNSSIDEDDEYGFESLLFEPDSSSQNLNSDDFLFSDYSEG